jgi:hypothetical protein
MLPLTYAHRVCVYVCVCVGGGRHDGSGRVDNVKAIDAASLPNVQVGPWLVVVRRAHRARWP